MGEPQGLMRTARRGSRIFVLVFATVTGCGRKSWSGTAACVRCLHAAARIADLRVLEVGLLSHLDDLPQR